MIVQQRVRLLSHGGHQTLDIPLGFELPGEEVVIRKKEGGLFIEPVAPKKKNLLELLAQMKPAEDEPFDLDEGSLPPDDIEL